MAEYFTAKGIEASYGPLQVLWGVDLTLREGEAALLLGANGAGKTTLLRALMGLVRVTAGTVTLAGDSVGGLPTDARVRKGMHFMTELGVFPNLSVEENLTVGGFGMPRSALRARIAELYEVFPDLRPKRGDAAATLSGGQRKMLGVAKAIVRRPRLLIMDEPSAGLSPRFVGEVVENLRRLHQDGLTLLIAEQNVRFLELAERAYVLEGGRVRFSGTVEELERNDAVRRAYFGLGT